MLKIQNKDYLNYKQNTQNSKLRYTKICLKYTKSMI